MARLNRNVEERLEEVSEPRELVSAHAKKEHVGRVATAPKTPHKPRAWKSVKADLPPKTPRRTKDSKSSGDEQRTVKPKCGDEANSLLSSLSDLKLEPDDAQPTAVRKSPRKAASCSRGYYIHDSLDIAEDSSSAVASEASDVSDLSDFIVNDSASEAELRRPPRSVRKQGFINPRRLVRRSPQEQASVPCEDTEDEVRVSKAKPEVINLISPTKRPSRRRGRESTSNESDLDMPCNPKTTIELGSPTKLPRSSQGQESDKDNSKIKEDTTLDLADQLSEIRLSPPGGGQLNHLGHKACTPPASPSRPRLKSPTRNRVQIPLSPHRPSIDSFWKPDVINDWNDVHSPKKAPRPAGRLLPFLLSPKKLSMRDLKDVLPSSGDEDGDSGYDSPSTKSPKKSISSPTKTPGQQRDRAALDAKKKFEAEKHSLAETFLRELDDTITHGEVSRLAASTGGVKLEWNKKLNSTAGRAKWKRERTRVTNKDDGDGPATVVTKHHASIELAAKVIDDKQRLLNVLAHEFCHLANFMVSGVKDSPHGREFKAWATKVSAAFGHRGVEVTTKHSYAIAYKYVWACTTCATEYKRHSRSIDIARHVCSACKGKLVQVQPPPRGEDRGGSPVKEGRGRREGLAGGGDGYNAFVKANFAKVKDEMGARALAEGKAKPAWGEVTAEVARRWKIQKGKASASGDSPADVKSNKEHGMVEESDEVNGMTEHLGDLSL